jgi:hypothetical protein
MTITLDEELGRQLAEVARLRGMDVSTVAAEMLRASLHEIRTPVFHSVMEFAGVGAGRPGAVQQDAQQYVESLRDEWEARERD